MAIKIKILSCQYKYNECNTEMQIMIWLSDNIRIRL
jgi:hypothetical protein